VLRPPWNMCCARWCLYMGDICTGLQSLAYTWESAMLRHIPALEANCLVLHCALISSHCVVATRTTTCIHEFGISKSFGSGFGLAPPSHSPTTSIFLALADPFFFMAHLSPVTLNSRCVHWSLMMPRGNYEQAFSLAVPSLFQGVLLDSSCSHALSCGFIEALGKRHPSMSQSRWRLCVMQLGKRELGLSL
jgi:hypothetical protein